MKLYGYLIIIIALGLAVFNAFQIDFNDPTSENSKVALIGIITSFCAIILTLIYMRSKKVAEKVMENNSNKSEEKIEEIAEEKN